MTIAKKTKNVSVLKIKYRSLVPLPLDISVPAVAVIQFCRAVLPHGRVSFIACRLAGKDKARWNVGARAICRFESRFNLLNLAVDRRADGFVVESRRITAHV
jgi:hypothetical protein